MRKLAAESPELGAYRVRAALEQIGIHLSQATCGRLFGPPSQSLRASFSKETAPRERKAMPYKATFRFEYWSVDVRYIEEHNLGFPEPVYLISILENSHSRAILASKISPHAKSVGLPAGPLCRALTLRRARRPLSAMAGGFFTVARRWTCMRL